ncbi:MAG TPA: Calx-beta domain-containing protein [Anaerolineae bacterium]
MKGKKNTFNHIWVWILTLVMVAAAHSHGVGGVAVDIPATASYAGAADTFSPSISGEGNQDILPIVSIQDAAGVEEGNSGTKPVTFTVTLSTASSQSVIVAYKTAPDTALAEIDFVRTSGLLTFAPGQRQKQIAISIVGDILFEEDETFYVTLIHAQNALVGDWIGRSTILNDDEGVFFPFIAHGR